MNKEWCEGLTEEKWETKHEQTDKLNMLLHGYCHTWAVMHFNTTDIIRCILENRDSKTGLVHCFLIRDGYFIDVRGKTKSMDNILESFDYGEFWMEDFTNLRAFNDFLKTLKLDLRASFIMEHIIRTTSDEDMCLLVTDIIHHHETGQRAERLVPLAIQLMNRIGSPDYHLREALDETENMILLEIAKRYCKPTKIDGLKCYTKIEPINYVKIAENAFKISDVYAAINDLRESTDEDASVYGQCLHDYELNAPLEIYQTFEKQGLAVNKTGDNQASLWCMAKGASEKLTEIEKQLDEYENNMNN